MTNERFTEWTGYYTYDPRGSVTGVTDDKGMIWQSYRYDAFGSLTFGQPQYNNVYTYNAESYNPNVDAQYLRARYYSPTTADFISEDSYLGKLTDPLSLNRYNYVKSSPLNYVDPSGHKIADNFDTFGYKKNILSFEKLSFDGTSKTEKKKGKVDWSVEFADSIARARACAAIKKIEEQARLYPDMFGNTDYISNQRDYDEYEIIFGLLGNISDNGCGSIAMYNVMHYLNNEITYEEILKDIVNDSEKLSLDHNGQNTSAYPTLLDGLGGMNPFYIDEYMERQGYTVSGKLDPEFHLGNGYKVDEYDAYIAMYMWQSSDGTMGAHYEALTPQKDGSLQGYNLNSNYKDFNDYVQIKKSDEGLYWVNVYQIDKR